MRPLCFVALRQPWPVLVLDTDQAAPTGRSAHAVPSMRH